MPSSAISDTSGFALSLYSASTQCAIAFTPLGPEIPGGNPSVSSGS